MDNRKKLKKELEKLFELEDFPDNLECSVKNLFRYEKIILYGAGAGFFTFVI